MQTEESPGTVMQVLQMGTCRPKQIAERNMPPKQKGATRGGRVRDRRDPMLDQTGNRNSWTYDADRSRINADHSRPDSPHLPEPVELAGTAAS